MVGRWISAVVALALAVMVAGCGDDGDDETTTGAAGSTKAIAGIWTGELRQEGLPSFRVAAFIGENGEGQVAYTGINCGGFWTPASQSPPSYSFTERINQGAGGNCKGSGSVALTENADGTLSYRFEGGGVISEGVLSHTSLQELRAVFREAGVGTVAPSAADKVPK